MQFAPFIRRLGFLLILGAAGFGSGCGSEPALPPVSKEQDDQVRADMKAAHQDYGRPSASTKEQERKIRADMRASHRGH